MSKKTRGKFNKLNLFFVVLFMMMLVGIVMSCGNDSLPTGNDATCRTKCAAAGKTGGVWCTTDLVCYCDDNTKIP